uniref:ZP domain-containing protein n=1 Tax=Panagrolaimus sp. PS1159 TaxID=55785 RepID=A0AC35F4P6_9BILA
KSYEAMMDNSLIGVPLIECSENAVTFTVKTKTSFRGNIYVRGKYDVPQCRQEYFSNDYNGATLTIPIGECGMTRVRQLDPNGMNYVLVFIAQFNPIFLTKNDRAYNVRCFYAHTENTVNAELEVDLLPTESLEQATIMKPICQYSLRTETADGPVVRLAKVGDPIVHRFECDNPNYGMLVKNCYVDDGAGNNKQVLDERGCPISFSANSPTILGELTYDTDLNRAFVTVDAVRFPDRGNMQFQCQIQICNKREEQCIGITPPNCPAITKSEFIPNSRINTKVNPTQIIGTFEELTTFPPSSTRRNNPSFIPSDGKGVASNQPFPTFARRSDIPPSTVSADFSRTGFAPFAPNLIQPERIAAHQNYPYFRKKDSPLSKNETDDDDAIVHFDNDIHNEKAWQEKPIILKRPNRSTRPYSNTLLPTTPSLPSTLISVNEKPSPRMRRDEEQTLDVIAQPIYIQDVGEDEPILDDTSNYHDITKDNIWTKQNYCTDKYGIYTLALLFAILALLALPSIIYTFYDVVFMRSKRRKGLISANEQFGPLPSINNLQHRIRPLNTEVMTSEIPYGIPRITPRQILNNR